MMQSALSSVQVWFRGQEELSNSLSVSRLESPLCVVANRTEDSSRHSAAPVSTLVRCLDNDRLGNPSQCLSSSLQATIFYYSAGKWAGSVWVRDESAVWTWNQCHKRWQFHVRAEGAAALELYYGITPDFSNLVEWQSYLHLYVH